MKSLPSTILLLFFVGTSLAKTSRPPEIASMEQKLSRIEANARSPHPDQTPTVFTEPEVNAYLASDDIVMPDGVQSVKLKGGPGIIT